MLLLASPSSRADGRLPAVCGLAAEAAAAAAAAADDTPFEDELPLVLGPPLALVQVLLLLEGCEWVAPSRGT